MNARTYFVPLKLIISRPLRFFFVTLWRTTGLNHRTSFKVILWYKLFLKSYFRVQEHSFLSRMPFFKKEKILVKHSSNQKMPLFFLYCYYDECVIDIFWGGYCTVLIWIHQCKQMYICWQYLFTFTWINDLSAAARAAACHGRSFFQLMTSRRRCCALQQKVFRLIFLHFNLLHLYTVIPSEGGIIQIF